MSERAREKEGTNDAEWDARVEASGRGWVCSFILCVEQLSNTLDEAQSTNATVINCDPIMSTSSNLQTHDCRSQAVVAACRQAVREGRAKKGILSPVLEATKQAPTPTAPHSHARMSAVLLWHGMHPAHTYRHLSHSSVCLFIVAVLLPHDRKSHESLC